MNSTNMILKLFGPEIEQIYQSVCILNKFYENTHLLARTLSVSHCLTSKNTFRRNCEENNVCAIIGPLRANKFNICLG